MQSSFPACLAFTLQEEGGYTVDRGGPTNYGVTLDTYRLYSGNNSLSAADLKAISPDTVSDIYRRDFWDRMNCANFPAGPDLLVFDMGINAGWMNSLYLLQRAVGEHVDGIVGPQTMAAVEAMHPIDLIEMLRRQQHRYYGEVRDASPDLIAALRARLARRVLRANQLASSSVGV